MTFKKKWFSNVIVSSEGYCVEIVDRATILYVDEMRRIFASAEAYAVNGNWALYPNDMRIGSVRGPQLFDEAVRTLVVSRIRAAFDFMRWPLHLL
jgi:hypothetical protein